MPPLPKAAFRSLLADCSKSAFADFVAGLWRARGREVRREGDRIVADGRTLQPVLAFDDQAPVADAGGTKDTIVVTATPPPAGAGSTILGPADLYSILLNDVARDRAADLFEAHFQRPLDDEEGTDSAGDDAARAKPVDDADSENSPSDESPAPESKPTDSTDGGSAANELAESTASSGNGDQQRLGRLAGLLSRGDRRGLFGYPKIEVAVVVVLLVVSASLWTLFFYEPSPEPSETPFTIEDQPVDGNYRIVARTHVTGEDGQSYFESSHTYAPGDPAAAVSRWTTTPSRSSHNEVTTVSYNRGNVSYERKSWDNASVYRDYVQHNQWRSFDRTNNGTQSIYQVENETGENTLAPLTVLVTGPLETLDYEREGTTTYAGREVVRYVPTEGWTATRTDPDREPRATWVSSSSGEVLVDAETGELLYADVDATIVPAQTWGDVLLESSTEFDVHYQVFPDVDRPRAPPWVDGLDATAGNETARNATVT